MYLVVLVQITAHYFYMSMPAWILRKCDMRTVNGGREKISVWSIWLTHTCNGPQWESDREWMYWLVRHRHNANVCMPQHTPTHAHIYFAVAHTARKKCIGANASSSNSIRMSMDAIVFVCDCATVCDLCMGVRFAKLICDFYSYNKFFFVVVVAAAVHLRVLQLLPLSLLLLLPLWNSSRKSCYM